MSRKCPCLEANKFNSLKRIFHKEINWFKEHEEDKDFLYDESCFQFLSLSRGDCFEILRILSED